MCFTSTGEEDDNFEKGVEVLDETGRLAGSMTMSVADTLNKQQIFHILKEEVKVFRCCTWGIEETFS